LRSGPTVQPCPRGLPASFLSRLISPVSSPFLVSISRKRRVFRMKGRNWRSFALRLEAGPSAWKAQQPDNESPAARELGKLQPSCFHSKPDWLGLGNREPVALPVCGPLREGWGLFSGSRPSRVSWGSAPAGGGRRKKGLSLVEVPEMHTAGAKAQR